MSQHFYKSEIFPIRIFNLLFSPNIILTSFLEMLNSQYLKGVNPILSRIAPAVVLSALLLPHISPEENIGFIKIRSALTNILQITVIKYSWRISYKDTELLEGKDSISEAKGKLVPVVYGAIRETLIQFFSQQIPKLQLYDLPRFIMFEDDKQADHVNRLKSYNRHIEGARNLVMTIFEKCVVDIKKFVFEFVYIARSIAIIPRDKIKILSEKTAITLSKPLFENTKINPMILIVKAALLEQTKVDSSKLDSIAIQSLAFILDMMKVDFNFAMLLFGADALPFLQYPNKNANKSSGSIADFLKFARNADGKGNPGWSQFSAKLLINSQEYIYNKVTDDLVKPFWEFMNAGKGMFFNYLDLSAGMAYNNLDVRMKVSSAIFLEFIKNPKTVNKFLASLSEEYEKAKGNSVDTCNNFMMGAMLFMTQLSSSILYLEECNARAKVADKKLNSKLNRQGFLKLLKEVNINTDEQTLAKLRLLKDRVMDALMDQVTIKNTEIMLENVPKNMIDSLYAFLDMMFDIDPKNTIPFFFNFTQNSQIHSKLRANFDESEKHNRKQIVDYNALKMMIIALGKLQLFENNYLSEKNEVMDTFKSYAADILKNHIVMNESTIGNRNIIENGMQALCSWGLIDALDVQSRNEIYKLYIEKYDALFLNEAWLTSKDDDNTSDKYKAELALYTAIDKIGVSLQKYYKIEYKVTEFKKKYSKKFKPQPATTTVIFK